MQVRDTFLPFSPPLIGEEEISEVADSLRTGWITTGPKVKRFEEEFACFVGAPSALGLNSWTAALHVALATLGVGSGCAVITTPMTFCSTVHVIEQVGARPRRRLWGRPLDHKFLPTDFFSRCRNTPAHLEAHVPPACV